MNKSLTRSIGFWLLIVLSLAAGAVGGWLVNSQLTTMTATLLDGTATGVEVYVGQSLAVLGAVLVGSGVLGIVIALALVTVRALIPTAAPAPLEPIDWSTSEADDAPVAATDAVEETAPDSPADATADADADSELAGTPRN